MITDEAPRILIVDDDDDSRELYGRFLTQSGYAAVFATSASEGFDVATKEHPTLAVIDVRLPGATDGLTLATKLRLDKRTRDIRIIILTACALGQERGRAAQAGCDLFLTKPCRPDHLLNHVRTLAPAGRDVLIREATV